MILEDIYDIEVLNEFQRSTYLRIAELLKPINEASLNSYQSATLVKFVAGNYFLQISLQPKAPDSYNVVLTLNTNDYILALDGFTSKVQIEAVPLSVSDDALGMLVTTLIRVFNGQVKIVEERSQGSPYRWRRYDFIEDSWQLQTTRQFLLYNYFGKKTSVVRYCRLY